MTLYCRQYKPPDHPARNNRANAFNLLMALYRPEIDLETERVH